MSVFSCAAYIRWPRGLAGDPLNPQERVGNRRAARLQKEVMEAVQQVLDTKPWVTR